MIGAHPQNSAHNPRHNRLLALVTGEDYARLLPALELVTLTAGNVLHEAGAQCGFAYFPLSCVISLLGTSASGASVELAMTGRDGLVGIPLVLGSDTTPYRIVVRSSGYAYRLPAEALHWELEQGGELQHLSLRYAHALMVQMAHVSLCGRSHSVEEQLARWLLQTIDLGTIPSSEDPLIVTQELIAGLLGLRREAIADAAGKLQQAGVIGYSRGRITMLDRPALEARACGCYATMHSEDSKLFRPLPAPLMRNRPRPNPATLRQRAESRLMQSLTRMPTSPPDITKLVRELQLRQIELEIHNEELTQSYEEADALRSRYADLYDFAPVGYCTIDPRGTVLQINLAAAILLGVKRSRIRRHRFGDSVSAESRPMFQAFLVAVLEGHSQRTCEITLMATKQRPTAVVSIKGVADETGKECRMVIIDITERRQAEARLEESEALNMAVLDSLTAHVAVIDAAGTLLAVNAAWKRFALENGCADPATSAPGYNYRDACRATQDKNGAEAEAAWHGIEQVLRGERDRFYLDYPCDSPAEPRWFRMSVFPLHGAVRGAVIAHENITAQKVAELALREREQYQRTLLDSFPFLIWLKDERSRFLAVNKPFAESFGWPSANSLIGKSDYDITTRELADSYRADDRAVLDSGRSKYVEEWIDSGGERRWFETYKSPVSLDGRVIGTVGYARDITDYYAPSEEAQAGDRRRHKRLAKK